MGIIAVRYNKTHVDKYPNENRNNDNSNKDNTHSSSMLICFSQPLIIPIILMKQ